LHVAKIKNIGNEVIGVVLYESKKMSFTEIYFNLYTIEGKVYAEGLKVPRNGFVSCTQDEYVFVSVDPQMGPNGQIIPPKLFRYKFRGPSQVQ